MEFKPYPDIVWQPTKELLANSQIQKFIHAAGVADYDELLAKSDQDPAWFWDTAIKFLDIKF